MIEAAGLGVVVLLGVLLAVQGAIFGFFFYLCKRARYVADLELDDEWLQLQRGTRTS